MRSLIIGSESLRLTRRSPLIVHVRHLAFYPILAAPICGSCLP
jgi:hypothetical protein